MKKVSYFLSIAFIVSLLANTQSQAQERKPWSPQAKGTVIGTTAGAAAGAIIHKRNRVAGGVVGGVVGGATGYAIGKRKDNKNKEAARVAAANNAAAERAAANRAASNRVATTKKSSNSYAKASVATNNTPVVAANGFTNSNAAMFNAAFLPNPYFGDRSKPYSDSEYRRKSW
jgi:hypothetical protein